MPELIRAYFGNSEWPQGKVYIVSEVYTLHENDKVNLSRDLAFPKTKQEIELSKTVQPIKLCKNSKYSTSNVSIATFGSLVLKLHRDQEKFKPDK